MQIAFPIINNYYVMSKKRNGLMSDKVVRCVSTIHVYDVYTLPTTDSATLINQKMRKFSKKHTLLVFYSTKILIWVNCSLPVHRTLPVHKYFTGP